MMVVKGDELRLECLKTSNLNSNTIQDHFLQAQGAEIAKLQGQLLKTCFSPAWM